jgi:hypothetical protein
LKNNSNEALNYGSFMSNSVFISGSISIKTLSPQIIGSLNTIIAKQLTIFVGDAPGIDTLIQDYCNAKNYFYVLIYTITSSPRYIANKKFNFKHIFVEQTIKKERERQGYKDRAMTNDSDYSFVIWDGSSKGSYSNILRSLKQNKPVKVYYTAIQEYLTANKVTELDITFIYRKNNGYKASEVIEYLQNCGIEKFKRSQDLNKFLLSENLLIKEDKVYKPTSKKPNLFIIESYRGKATGIKFNNDFIDWIEKNSSVIEIEQPSLFD